MTIIEQYLPQITYLIGILWAILLDGLLVERGRNYVKVRVLDHKFKSTDIGFIWFIVEIIIISYLISHVFYTIIENLLRTKPFWTIGLSLIAAYIRFYIDIHEKPPWISKLGLR